MPIKVQEAYRTINRLDKKNPKQTNTKPKFTHHILIKTLNLQNKKRILRASKKKGQHKKTDMAELHLTSQYKQ